VCVCVLQTANPKLTHTLLASWSPPATWTYFAGFISETLYPQQASGSPGPTSRSGVTSETLNPQPKDLVEGADDGARVRVEKRDHRWGSLEDLHPPAEVVALLIQGEESVPGPRRSTRVLDCVFPLTSASQARGYILPTDALFDLPSHTPFHSKT